MKAFAMNQQSGARAIQYMGRNLEIFAEKLPEKERNHLIKSYTMLHLFTRAEQLELPF